MANQTLIPIGFFNWIQNKNYFAVPLLLLFFGANAFAKDKMVAKIFKRDVTIGEITPSTTDFESIKSDYGMVFGKAPGNDTDLMLEIRTRQIISLVLKPINDEFEKTTDINPTQAEIDEYLSKIGIGRPPLNPTQEERASMARAREENINTIKTFKLLQALYQKYGGIVVSDGMSAPLLPLGAYRHLIEKYQKTNDIVIYDEELNKAFWKFFDLQNRKDVISKEQFDFSKPWWRIYTN